MVARLLGEATESKTAAGLGAGLNRSSLDGEELEASGSWSSELGSIILACSEYSHFSSPLLATIPTVSQPNPPQYRLSTHHTPHTTHRSKNTGSPTHKSSAQPAVLLQG